MFSEELVLTRPSVRTVTNLDTLVLRSFCGRLNLSPYKSPYDEHLVRVQGWSVVYEDVSSNGQVGVLDREVGPHLRLLLYCRPVSIGFLRGDPSTVDSTLDFSPVRTSRKSYLWKRKKRQKDHSLVSRDVCHPRVIHKRFTYYRGFLDSWEYPGIITIFIIFYLQLWHW